MALSTDFNVDPYYDDYDETKNFHRVLFKPGYAVQAREVTQLQTILQKQIERHGEHLFKNGSIVLGCELNYDNEAKSLKLETQYSGADVSVSNFANTIINGGTSNLILSNNGQSLTLVYVDATRGWVYKTNYTS